MKQRISKALKIMPLEKELVISKVKGPTTSPKYGKGYSVTREVVKVKKDYSGIFPSGIDHGRGAKNLLFSVVDEILDRNRKHELPDIEEFPPITSKFEHSEFIQKLNSMQLNDIPLYSQIVTQDAIWPTHTSEKRKRIMGIRRRLERNDGSLVRLRLNSEEIDDSMLHLLTEVIPKNFYLQHLMLHENVITDKGVEHLSLAARFHPMLHTIWLGGNQISDYGMIHIASLIGLNNNIKDVNISNKWPRQTWSGREAVMHPHITVQGAEAIAKQLQRGCGLTSLSLADQRIRDAGAILIFKALLMSNLRTLNLKSNELTDKCTPSLQDAIRKNCLVEQLVISCNRIRNSGCSSIALALTYNTILRALDISQNMIEDRGMQSLVDCLAKNHLLSSLVTHGNAIDDNRAEEIVALRCAATSALHHHPERLPLRDSASIDADSPSIRPYGDMHTSTTRAQTSSHLPIYYDMPFNSAKKSAIAEGVAVGDNWGHSSDSRPSTSVRLDTLANMGRVMSAPYSADSNDNNRDINNRDINNRDISSSSSGVSTEQALVATSSTRIENHMPRGTAVGAQVGAGTITCNVSGVGISGRRPLSRSLRPGSMGGTDGAFESHRLGTVRRTPNRSAEGPRLGTGTETGAGTEASLFETSRSRSRSRSRSALRGDDEHDFKEMFSQTVPLPPAALLPSSSPSFSMTALDSTNSLVLSSNSADYSISDFYQNHGSSSSFASLGSPNNAKVVSFESDPNPIPATAQTSLHGTRKSTSSLVSLLTSTGVKEEYGVPWETGTLQARMGYLRN